MISGLHTAINWTHPPLALALITALNKMLLRLSEAQPAFTIQVS